ncbi:MAG: enoyl-CoA hydratase/isomerase family protein [Dehalococcoidia bacterium]|nr:enoyl-CoA hydratase/isomerase family protein [Dehalococcoidia bacterium]
MSFECLTYDKQDHIATVTLNRPERLNALNRALQLEVVAAANEARSDDDVWAIIVTGAGRGFCSGADISGPRPDGPQATPPQNQLLDEFHWVGDQAMAIYNLDKPTIAAMNGVCAGAGMSLALSCDLRVGSENARFRSVFLERNLSPDSGMSWFLTRILGYSRAIDLILTSRDVAADEAYRLGLLDRLVPHDRLMEEALALAHQITRWPPVAVRAAKRVTQQNLNKDLEDGLRNEAYHLEYGRKAKNDSREALTARMEKRDPVYTGT